MWIFSTREIAIFIYAIILLGYVLLHKKGKSILLPIIPLKGLKSLKQVHAQRC